MDTARRTKSKTKEDMRLENIQKSKKMMSIDPTPDITFAMDQAKKRVRYWLKEYRKPLLYSTAKMVDKLPLAVYTDLIGELRSAESRKRISTFQHQMKNIKKSRVQYLIDQQPNAVEAIRLKGLLKEDLNIKRHLSMKFLNIVERRRLEQLIGMNIQSLAAKE